MTANKLIRSLVVATLVSAALPVVALAAPSDAAHDDRQGEKGAKGEKRFPMEAAKFRARAEERLAKVKGRLEAKLDERKVPAEKRAKALAKFEASAKQIRAAVERVAKDGTVSKDEAREVRELARELRQKARGEHRKNKGEGRGGGQGRGHADDDAL
jgi:hypothetical protein